jgi:hypothetical protein
MFPPHGPPSPETHPHADSAVGTLSQLAPTGQTPPHAPAASLPHGTRHSADGPGQQATVPAGVRQMQSCSHRPFTQRSAVHELSSAQSPSVAQPGVGVGRVTGMHWHVPAASGAHCPWITNSISGHACPGGQAGSITHGPPQAFPPHWGVGVSGGVGWSGTQSHVPLAPIAHCPCRTGMSGPLQTWPAGHGTGTTTVHGPPHGTALHCGVGVGRAVAVGGGETGAQRQAPAASGVHAPTRLTSFGHGWPAGHGGEMTHGPPHGTLEHCGTGVGGGHCRVQI